MPTHKPTPAFRVLLSAAKAEYVKQHFILQIRPGSLITPRSAGRSAVLPASARTLRVAAAVTEPSTMPAGWSPPVVGASTTRKRASCAGGSPALLIVIIGGIPPTTATTAAFPSFAGRPGSAFGLSKPVATSLI